MLRTFARMAFGATVPATADGHRGATVVPPWARVPIGAGTRTAAIAVTRTAAPMRAPWGEAPGLAALAIVTTEPFPTEWWRRPRTAPPDGPFTGSRSGSALPTAVAPEPTAAKMPRVPTPDSVEQRRARARRRRGLFARICLLVAGGLISFIVLDAASRHGRRR